MTGGLQHPVPEASSHDLIAVNCVLEIPAKTIIVSARPMNALEVQQKVNEADKEAWSSRWLRMPPRTIGLPKTHGREGCQYLRAPVRPRTLFRQNLARKVSLWLDEITHILSRGVWLIPQQAAVDKLCAKLHRIPWQAWCSLTGTPIPTPFGTLWAKARDWSMWAHHYWSSVHASILDQARHGLKAWREAMKTAVETGRLKPIGKWIKGATDLPI